MTAGNRRSFCATSRGRPTSGSRLAPNIYAPKNVHFAWLKERGLRSQSTVCIEAQISDRPPQDSRLKSQKGGVEFINFPFVLFGSEICSEQLSRTTARIRGQIQKGQTGSTRTQEFQESQNLIFDPNFWPYGLWPQ